MEGIYTLVLFLPKKKKIRVGKLGCFLFPKGYYVYVGSGMRNLEHRISRYFRIRKKKWHIDYLVSNSIIKKVVFAKTRKKVECNLSICLEKFSHRLWKKFGSMDCKCYSHLHYFKKLKDVDNALKKSYRKLKLKSFVWKSG